MQSVKPAVWKSVKPLTVCLGGTGEDTQPDEERVKCVRLNISSDAAHGLQKRRTIRY